MWLYGGARKGVSVGQRSKSAASWGRKSDREPRACWSFLPAWGLLERRPGCQESWLPHPWNAVSTPRAPKFHAYSVPDTECGGGGLGTWRHQQTVALPLNHGCLSSGDVSRRGRR